MVSTTDRREKRSGEKRQTSAFAARLLASSPGVLPVSGNLPGVPSPEPLEKPAESSIELWTAHSQRSLWTHFVGVRLERHRYLHPGVVPRGHDQMKDAVYGRSYPREAGLLMLCDSDNSRMKAAMPASRACLFRIQENTRVSGLLGTV